MSAFSELIKSLPSWEKERREKILNDPSHPQYEITKYFQAEREKNQKILDKWFTKEDIDSLYRLNKRIRYNTEYEDIKMACRCTALMFEKISKNNRRKNEQKK